MEEGVTRVRLPRRGELFGVIESMLGVGKLMVRCEDKKMRICRIPGKLRKRVWMRVGDAVILKPWEVQSDERANIVWRYTKTEVSWLRNRKLLNFEM